MAKARTVRTLPSASSATTVALATCRERGASGDSQAVASQEAGQGALGEGYLLLCLAGQAAEEGADDGPGAHQRGQRHQQEPREARREQVQRHKAARGLGAAAQALREARRGSAGATGDQELAGLTGR